MLSTIKVDTTTRLRFRLKTDGTATTLIASTGDLSENLWVHVAAVYDGSAMRLYLNGVEVGSSSKSGLITTDSSVPVWIGGSPSGATDRPWDGRIADVRIYERALTAEEIQQLIPAEN